VLIATFVVVNVARAATYIPASDSQVLAELPAGARHANAASQEVARSRIDIAVPLTQFYIARARATGDLRFLGYAESILAPWLRKPGTPSEVRVLYATVLQSRHSFSAALVELDRALQSNPNNPQAWLTRATVLRVLGRYAEALASCRHLAATADAPIGTLCEQSIRRLSGNLQSAYSAVASVSPQSLAPEARAWRYSELGEMAERLGDDSAAEHWLKEGLQVSPDDFYMRTAYADLLLRQKRAAETVALLQGFESIEPMLLRVAIAKGLLEGGTNAAARDLLATTFAVEEQRGDGVHRREEARFYLDVDPKPEAALAAARQNWLVQREPDDLLVLLRAARSAHRPQDAQPAREFLAREKLQDVRLASYVEAAQ
jgi:tetratricopeptide (TPR) repeat protein